MSHTPEVKGQCWQWPGTLDQEGYARLQTCNGWSRVQRLIYEAVNGAIHEGLVIDHLCRNRACFNPKHLEAVTNKVNVLRGIGQTAQNARKTHCKNGHALSPNNIERSMLPKRHCVVCARRRRREWEQRRRAKGWHSKRINGKMTWIAP